MTYKEIYDNLANDLKKVQIKEEYLRSRAIREFKKERKFPAYRWYEYTIPSTKNTYVIYFYAESKLSIEKPMVDNFAIVFENKKRFVIKWAAGGYKHTENSPLVFIRQIHAYTSHFFERYNERILHNSTLSANDVSCIYLSRNKLEEGIPIEMNEEINKHLKQYGEDAKFGFRVRDGFCFAMSRCEGEIDAGGDRTKDKVNAMLVLYTTFMNESDMGESQRSAIKRGCLKTWRHYIQDIKNNTKDGYIRVRLEP
ncbi:MAG: hypothetical protein IJZ67_02100 [Alistipes sp.]|nr:hypothetical protein [Alistipes sp.]